MQLTIALIFATLSTTVVCAETYNYSCKPCIFPPIAGDGDGCDVVDGKTYPLRVDDNKNVLEWRGKRYRVTNANEVRQNCMRQSGLARRGQWNVIYILRCDAGVWSHSGQGRKCQSPMRS